MNDTCLILYLSSTAMQADAALIHRPENLRWLAGYTGEGCLFIAKDARVILTDFRYVEQVERQAPECTCVRTRNGVTELRSAVDPETGALSAGFDVQGFEATIQLTLLEDGSMLVTGTVFDMELMRSIYYRLAD